MGSGSPITNLPTASVTSAEGARRRAQRGRWTRQRGNDGLARVMVPNDALDAPRPVRAGRPDEQSPDPAHFLAAATIAALEAHVETLKAQLAAAEGTASEEANALREHNATLKADVERLEAMLAAERARADKAIAAFASLAERLDALAVERTKPWWRRLVGLTRKTQCPVP